jgi:Secretion system C-terminal sorting domain
MRKLIPLLLLVLCSSACFTQPPTYTANDIVPPFQENFGYGSNMGYFPPDYYDDQLAILSHGSPDGIVPGVGVNCIRPALFDHFLDYWGYDIRLNTFKLYDSIGMKNNTVFLGFPAEKHRDSTSYCNGSYSELFRGMYEPIWDLGENGTPVNDKNFYALYLWKTVSTYKKYVKFWEIWNEPDLDMSGNGWKSPTMDGNWWTNTPGPCETKLKAPLYHYIRLLRISYEVIKKADPTAYVAIGGIGYPSYLDAILRNTDNPSNGITSTKYPKKGGAYFDVLSYHSYPHIEGYTRAWNDNINDFSYFRHSDACVDGIWKKKNEFQSVLNKYGYNGITYPDKQWIITEINIPRKQFGDFIGSDAAQTNFMMKALITAQQENVDQMYIYSLADEVPEAEAKNEFGFMGLFENLNGIKPYAGRANQVATGFKTTSDVISNAKYDSIQTNLLNLPSNVKGCAFKDTNGKYIYALWSVTTLDRDETSYATYTFPNELGINYLDQKYWHFSKTKAHHLVNAKQVKLTAAPSFFSESDFSTLTYPKNVKVYPNPISTGFGIYSFWLYESNNTTIEVFDAKGKKIETIAQNENLPEGAHQRLLDWSTFAAGTYFIRLISGETNTVIPVVKI